MQQLNLSKDAVNFLLDLAGNIKIDGEASIVNEMETVKDCFLDIARQLKGDKPDGVDPELFGEYIQSHSDLSYTEWIEYKIFESRKKELKWISIEDGKCFEYDKYYLFGKEVDGVMKFSCVHITIHEHEEKILVNGCDLNSLKIMGWTHYAAGLKY